eukprot:scaffold103541_cov71-Attheya_sp.AAC.1
MDGLDIRMADITKQDRDFSLGIMHTLINKYEADWKEKGEDVDIDEIVAALFLTVTFSSSMKGYETMWNDLATLWAELANIELTRDSGEVQGGMRNRGVKEADINSMCQWQ